MTRQSDDVHLASDYRYSAGQSPGAALREGFADLGRGLALYRTWMPLAWRDLRLATQRTLLGPLWSLIGTGIQIAALGYVYGALLNTAPREGYPYIAAGLILWYFVGATVLGGLTMFVNAAGVLKERALPVSFTLFRFTFRAFIELCYKLIVYVFFAVIVQLPPSWNMLLAAPGLLLYLLNGLWVAVLFGLAGARYRDVRELVAPLMLIAFLATPVLWHKELLAGRSFIADYNPLAHYLAIVREPLLGQLPPMESVAVVLALTAAGWLIAAPAFALSKNRVVFWL